MHPFAMQMFMTANLIPSHSYAEWINKTRHCCCLCWSLVVSFLCLIWQCHQPEYLPGNTAEAVWEKRKQSPQTDWKKNSVTVRCHLNDPLARWITRLRLYPFFETKNLIFQEQRTFCVDHWDIYRVTRQAGVPILGHETLFWSPTEPTCT